MAEKRILWLSRHAPAPEQVSELESAFGSSLEIVQVSITVQSGKEVAGLLRDHGCDELVAVLPPHLLQQVLAEGVRPLRAVMNRQVDEEGNVVFRHNHFERVLRVEVVTERLIQEPRACNCGSGEPWTTCHAESSYCG